MATLRVVDGRMVRDTSAKVVAADGVIFRGASAGTPPVATPLPVFDHHYRMKR